MKKFLGYVLAMWNKFGRYEYYEGFRECSSFLKQASIFKSAEAARGAIQAISNMARWHGDFEIQPVAMVDGKIVVLSENCADVKFCIRDEKFDYVEVSDSEFNSYVFGMSERFSDAIILDDISECKVILNLESWEGYSLHALPVINGEPQLDFEPIEI